MNNGTLLEMPRNGVDFSVGFTETSSPAGAAIMLPFTYPILYFPQDAKWGGVGVMRWADCRDDLREAPWYVDGLEGP